MNERTANQSLDVAFFILGDPFVGYECFYSSHVRKGSGGTPAEGARNGPSNWAFIPQTKGGTTGVGFLLVFYRIAFLLHDCSSPGYLGLGT